MLDDNQLTVDRRPLFPWRLNNVLNQTRRLDQCFCVSIQVKDTAAAAQLCECIAPPEGACHARRHARR
jgi:hypothetical protein